MADVLIPRPRGPVRGRPFAKGQSGHPAGRPAGARNKKTLAAAVLLDGEAEALTRRAVELAFAGDPMALRLCIERILPPCRERAVKFALPPIESAADIAAAMKAVTAALAAGDITPGEAERIAAVVDTFVRAIETSDFERRLKIVEDEHAAQLSDVPECSAPGWTGKRSASSALRAAYQSRASISSARAAGLKTTDGTLSAAVGARR